jgi:hypothetical protein
MSWPPNRRKLNEHISSPSPVSSKDEQRHHVMDDITHGQWSKNHYNEDNNPYNHSQSEDTLDPYNMQQNFRKMANKLSRRL